MDQLKRFVAIVLAVLVALFAVQNMALVNIEFLLWSFQAPRALVLLVVFLLGMLAGALLSRRSGHAHRGG